MVAKHTNKSIYSQLHSHENAVKPVNEANWVLFETVWYSIRLLPCPYTLQGPCNRFQLKGSRFHDWVEASIFFLISTIFTKNHLDESRK